MKMIRGLGVATAIFGAAVFAAACSSSGGGTSAGAGNGGSASATPFHILAILPITGVASSYGVAVADGVKAGVNVANVHGGVDGHKIDLTIQDDANSTPQAVTLFQSALTSSSPPNALLTFSSAETLALAPFAVKAGIPMGSLAAASDVADASKYPTFLSMGPSFTTADNSLMGYVGEKGYKKISILVTNDPTSSGSMAIFEDYMKTHPGFTYTADEVDINLVDATPVLQRIQAEHPDAVVFSIGQGSAGAALLKARRELGITTPFFGDISAGSYPWSTQTTPADWKGITVQLQPFQVASSPMVTDAQYNTFRQALSKYEAASLTGSVGLAIYVHPYDFVQLMAASADESKSISPQAILKAARSFQTGAEVSGMVYTGTLWTDPTSTFAAMKTTDFGYVALGPSKNGLFAGQ